MRHTLLPDESLSAAADPLDGSGEFFSALSHELRTPLAAIKAYAQGLSVHWERMPEPARYQYVQRIMRSTARMERLVGDLAVAARLADGAALQSSAVDVTSVVAQAIEEVQALYAIRAFSVAMPAPVLAVWADRERVVQILVNLLDNGAKYSPADAPVTVHWLHAGPYVRIEVNDAGPTLSSDERAYLFQRHHRLQAHGPSGSGLGLYICKSLAEAMGGRIGLDSPAAGAGNSFWFDLPCHQI